MLKRICIFFIFIIILVSCAVKRESFQVGIDPTFYPARLHGKEANVYAFSKELLHAISLEENVFFHTVTVRWDALMFGLKDKQYQGILNAMIPRANLQNTYLFSKPYLYMGPVLIVKKEGDGTQAVSFKGKEIGVISTQQEALVAENYPEAQVRYYDSIPAALEDVVGSEIDGVLVDHLQAIAYARHIYRSQIAIASPPLTEVGLSLIALKGEGERLLEVFERGLEKLQQSGMYERLLKKWDLS